MENATVLQNLSPEDVKNIIAESVQAAIEKISKPKSFTTRAEIGKKFNLSLPTVDARIADGTFKTFRIGHRVYIDLDGSNLTAARKRKTFESIRD